MHVGAALDLSVLVGGDTPVLTRVRLGHLSDLQFGLLALLLNRDAAAMRDLPPLALHPFHVGDGVSAHFSDEGGDALCETTGGELEKLQNLIINFTFTLMATAKTCLLLNSEF